LRLQRFRITGTRKTNIIQIEEKRKRKRRTRAKEEALAINATTERTRTP
jgi:hypothetical protein